MSVNPYYPPTATDLADLEPTSPAGASRIGNGPSVAIALGGLCGFLVGLPLMQRQNPIGLAIAAAGWIIGGFVFRRLSAKWPHAPYVRRRQLAVSLVALTLPPAVTFFLFDVQYPHLIILSEVLGLSIAAGVLVSGTRRFRPSLKLANPEDTHDSLATESLTTGR